VVICCSRINPSTFRMREAVEPSRDLPEPEDATPGQFSLRPSSQFRQRKRRASKSEERRSSHSDAGTVNHHCCALQHVVHPRDTPANALSPPQREKSPHPIPFLVLYCVPATAVSVLHCTCTAPVWEYTARTITTTTSIITTLPTPALRHSTLSPGSTIASTLLTPTTLTIYTRAIHAYNRSPFIHPQQ
jgi:hypothetical protein